MLRAALCLLPAGLREVNWEREKAKRKPGVLWPSPKSAFFQHLLKLEIPAFKSCHGSKVCGQKATQLKYIFSWASHY